MYCTIVTTDPNSRVVIEKDLVKTEEALPGTLVEDWLAEMNITEDLPQKTTLKNGAQAYVFTPEVIDELHVRFHAPMTNFTNIQVLTDLVAYAAGEHTGNRRIPQLDNSSKECLHPNDGVKLIRAARAWTEDYIRGCEAISHRLFDNNDESDGNVYVYLIGEDQLPSVVFIA